MNTYSIGKETKLTCPEWRKAFLASLDNGDMSHDSYLFLLANRYPDDGEDALLEEYADWCKEHNYDF